MSEAAAISAPARQILVAVLAQDVGRRAALLKAMRDAGHHCVASPAEADVVICDGDAPSTAAQNVVTLGGTNASRERGGALARDADPRQIDAAVRAVAAGLIVRSADVAQGGFAALEETERDGLLTPRELEVLNAIGDGLTNKEIARRLAISPHTVKFHVEALFRKLGARTRTEAAAKAWERRRSETVEL